MQVQKGNFLEVREIQSIVILDQEDELYLMMQKYGGVTKINSCGISYRRMRTKNYSSLPETGHAGLFCNIFQKLTKRDLAGDFSSHLPVKNLKISQKSSFFHSTPAFFATFL